MAEKDEYIQSPDLKVSTKTNKTVGREASSSSLSGAHSSSEIPAVVDDLSSKFVDVISKAARSPSRTPSVASSRASSPRTQSQTLEISSKKIDVHSSKSALMPSVAAIYEQNSNTKRTTVQQKQKTNQVQLSSTQKSKATPIKNKHALILQQLEYDSDSDSSDSDQSKDSHSQSHHALHEELEFEINESIRSESKESSSNLERKDPNRFMTMAAELEIEREALITNNIPAPIAAGPSYKSNIDARGGLRGGTAGEETNKALRAGLSWVQKVATPQLNAISQHIMTKVADTSRTDNKQRSIESGPMIPSRSKLQDTEADEENITVTTSSTFLSADEIAEFEKMKSSSSQSNLLAMIVPVVEAIRGNRRMAFVAVTMILSLFVYFYSRKRSVDDVL